MKIFVLLLCCSVALATESQNAIEQPIITEPIVQTSNGPIKGSIMQSRLGRQFFAFRGIRYGEAPIGEKRFKTAEPAKPFTGIFDASEEGPACPTMLHDNHHVGMSEDCLRMNVYTPELTANTTKDVVVFIHPCVFAMWSGISYHFGPQHLLDRDIVLVTMNHRLGSLGFMATGDERAPGNAGLKDQVLALKWIQNEIHNFGGNPGSVTLVGYSHGAWSLQAHLVSPMSKGLFHAIVSMSGGLTSHNPLPREQIHLAQIQAEAIGCPIDTLDNMFQCLYSKPTEDYINSIHNVYMAEDPIGQGVFVWQPVVEPESYGPDSKEVPFITKQIVDLLMEKKADFVPLIVGVTEEEFGGDVMPIEEQARNGNSSMYDLFNTNWERMSVEISNYNPATVSGRISAELRSLYLGGVDVGLGRWEGLSNMFADRMIFPTHRFKTLMETYSTKPVYNYMFAYAGCETFARWSNGLAFGVSHHDDLLMYFKVGGFPAVCDKDTETLERLTGMIEHFAKTKTPIPANSEQYFNLTWEPTTSTSPKYMKIGKEWSMQSGNIYADRMAKWDQLFPLAPFGDSNPMPYHYKGSNHHYEQSQHQHGGHHHGGHQHSEHQHDEHEHHHE